MEDLSIHFSWPGASPRKKAFILEWDWANETIGCRNLEYILSNEFRTSMQLPYPMRLPKHLPFTVSQDCYCDSELNGIFFSGLNHTPIITAWVFSIYIFIYQFTGSYLFNIAEYVIWALAFSQVFEEFDRKIS